MKSSAHMITVNSAKCSGINAIPITVEISISSGIGIHLVGLADAAVKESLLRTVTALQSAGFRIPGKKIVINLAPADLHKSGSGFDLPIALGIISASGQKNLENMERFVIAGELGLDGSVKSVPGALPIVGMAEENGFSGCIFPESSAAETAGCCDIPVYGIKTLDDAIRIAEGVEDCSRMLVAENMPGTGGHTDGDILDFSEIYGQNEVKRGLEIAAAGGHNVLLIGPPGSGKSSLARALATIMPEMSREEAIETSKIYSVAGKSPTYGGLMMSRPFRAPHYSASLPSIIGGGGSVILPGEISLAHNGILFLDEFCEIPRKTSEALRAPLEDREVTISRLRDKVRYPASFMLVAASNPCPCGHYGDGDRCRCSIAKRMNYISRLSGPVLDRIDIQLWVPPVKASDMVRRKKGESSATIASRVRRARMSQQSRLAGEGIFTNSEMNSRQTEKYCMTDNEGSRFLEKAMENGHLSARSCSRILKVARTIADLEKEENIRKEHIAEALRYRILDKKEMLF